MCLYYLIKHANIYVYAYIFYPPAKKKQKNNNRSY